jgi:hypothetical protein
MKPFAIYFPQFYPTPTNNQAWGHGFTDWALLANANLRNQWIRRAPLRGFYDGSSSEIHQAQIDDMKRFDLGGFALYHYWFFTHQELGAFEATILKRPPGLPWFLIWASEGWSKRWLGDSTSIVHLSPSPTDAEIGKHCDYLVTCFESPDYLQLDGRPLFIFYNLSHFQNADDVLTRYREAIKQRGYDVCLGHFVKNPFEVRYSDLVDVTYLFEPRLFFGIQRAGRGNASKYIHDGLKSIFGQAVVSRLALLMDQFQQRGISYKAQLFLSYLRSENRAAVVRKIEGPVQDVLSPGWNNKPRYSDRFTSMESVDAQVFAEILREASDRCALLPPLVNAWNEWSEGAAIEPCAYYGTRYLDAISLESFNLSNHPNLNNES